MLSSAGGDVGGNVMYKLGHTQPILRHHCCVAVERHGRMTGRPGASCEIVLQRSMANDTLLCWPLTYVAAIMFTPQVDSLFKSLPLLRHSH
jgi:hypothetical protein